MTVPGARRVRPGLVWVCLAVLTTGGCVAPDRPPSLVLATTTSVGNSGLLDVLLPAFERETQTAVRVHLVGSGLALQFLERGQADVAISHAPDMEARALTAHPGWWYRKLMYNDFLIVGPPADPAGVAASSSLEDAMRRVAASDVRVVSRGDASGTHAREQELWRAAGVTPAPDRLIISGQGMSATLRVADELRAYTLVDRGTFTALDGTIALVVVRSGDAQLLNTYAVLFDPAGPNVGTRAGARRLGEWLTDGHGRDLVAGFRLAGQPAFTVWPRARRRDGPDARPF